MKHLDIQLAISQVDKSLFCTMTFSNLGDEKLFLSRTDICLEKKLTSKILKIYQKDHEVPYLGIMLKRGIATAKDFIVLPPGERVSTIVQLGSKYDFLPGRHTYSVQYSCYHSSPEENPQLNKFESAVFHFDYVK